MPWVSNHFSHGMPNISSHLPSFVSPPYANPCFGSRGMMPPYYPSPFGGSHIPQKPLTIGGWNLLSYKSTLREANAQIGNNSTYYIPSTYPSSAMSVPTNTFPMDDLHLSYGVSSGGIYFYSMGNPLHKVPSSRGNMYPYLNNTYHAFVSSQKYTSVSMPLQPFMNQYGGGYYLVG
jgi:hypothetical protein